MPLKESLKRNKLLIVLAVVAMLCVVVFVNAPHQEDRVYDHKIVLYGFSIKGEVMKESIIPAFQAYWASNHSESVDFQTTFAGSSDVTNQVLNGAPADVMILSTEWDALQLKKSGLATTDWNTLPYNGTVSTSPWVIMTRTGNPHNITDFSDLAKPGIEIVHPDPLTSGGACWSIFSIYGSTLRDTNNTSAADDMVAAIMHNVISWQSSARGALSQFNMGYGDALITYESDAKLAQNKTNNYEIIYPHSTISSEHKVVVVDKNVGAGEREVVDAFVQFLFTDQSQQMMVDHGFRTMSNVSMNATIFPPILDPFYVSYLDGWENAHAELIEGLFADIKG